jgi:hypothetical protein
VKVSNADVQKSIDGLKKRGLLDDKLRVPAR